MGSLQTNCLGVIILPVFLFGSGCGGCGPSSNSAPEPGGGPHEITGISIGADCAVPGGGTEYRWLDQPAKVEFALGAPVPLGVSARWAIPSVTDVTNECTFTVSDSTVAVVDAQAVFRPRRAGVVDVTAVYDYVEPGPPNAPRAPKQFTAVATIRVTSVPR